MEYLYEPRVIDVIHNMTREMQYGDLIHYAIQNVLNNLEDAELISLLEPVEHLMNIRRNTRPFSFRMEQGPRGPVTYVGIQPGAELNRSLLYYYLIGLFRIPTQWVVMDQLWDTPLIIDAEDVYIEIHVQEGIEDEFKIDEFLELPRLDPEEKEIQTLYSAQYGEAYTVMKTVRESQIVANEIENEVQIYVDSDVMTNVEDFLPFELGAILAGMSQTPFVVFQDDIEQEFGVTTRVLLLTGMGDSLSFLSLRFIQY